MKINDLEVREIPYLPNYVVTKCGIVFRKDTKRKMKIYPTGRTKYSGFRACHKNKPTTEFVHVAVASSWVFNPDPENKTQVNHKDGDRTNPHADNLEWVTPAENQRHAIDSNLKGKGQDLYNASLTDDQVHLICKELEEGAQIKYLSDKYLTSKDVIRKIRSKSTYFHIVRFYDFYYDWKYNLSENTVRWVCGKILDGVSDANISKISDNKLVTPIEVKRIRHKVKYKTITDEYF
uniref:HNH homing endonuclease n=1 Tax=Vibrio phage P018-4 TaxID=3229728 RepID=A0AB39AJ82_9CAUD